jgi:hypothetical protein
MDRDDHRFWNSLSDKAVLWNLNGIHGLDNEGTKEYGTRLPDEGEKAFIDYCKKFRQEPYYIFMKKYKVFRIMK